MQKRNVFLFVCSYLSTSLVSCSELLEWKGNFVVLLPDMELFMVRFLPFNWSWWLLMLLTQLAYSCFCPWETCVSSFFSDFFEELFFLFLSSVSFVQQVHVQTSKAVATWIWRLEGVLSPTYTSRKIVLSKVLDGWHHVMCFFVRSQAIYVVLTILPFKSNWRACFEKVMLGT